MAYSLKFDLSIFIIAVIVNTLLMIQMRLGDELKDYEKDKIMHPNRPLPRGLLSTDQVRSALIKVFGLIVTIGILLGIFQSPIGGLCVVLSAVLAWLMFKEFYIGQSLNKEPILYAITHQAIVFPIHAWIGLSLDQNLLSSTPFIGWLLANFGASFTFEICRKLDPATHPMAQTYAQHYGRKLTFIFISILIFISGFGVKLAGMNIALFALIPLWISLLLWVQKPSLYKIAAGLSVLSSLTILWTPAILWLMLNWRNS